MAENLMDELWQKFKMLDAAIKELRSRGSALCPGGAGLSGRAGKMHPAGAGEGNTCNYHL